MANRREQSAEATQRALLRAGRRLFGRKGYAAAGIEEIAARARVTTGALYHHFGSKKRLFQAVAEQIEQELVERAIAEGTRYEDSWRGLVAGVEHLLDATLAPEIRQIALSDAPRVFGVARWRKIEERYSLGLLRDALRGMMENGLIRAGDPDLLANALFALTNELATQVGQAKNPAEARREASALAVGFLESLRP